MTEKLETFTIRVQVHSKEEAAWIHDGLKSTEAINGVTVRAISTGDMFAELSAKEDMCEIFKDKATGIMDDDSDWEEIDKLTIEYDKAGERYQ